MDAPTYAWPLPRPSLPHDILLHIFDMGTFHSPGLDDRTDFPLLISQVNKTWRSLALQSSRLWATIVYKGHPKFVVMPIMHGAKHKRKINPRSSFYYPLIYLFLERSRAQPLSIYIDIRHRDHDYTVREVDVGGEGHPIDPLLRLLTPHGARFKHFSFIANTWIDIIQLLRFHIYHLRMPQLESFELSRAYLSQSFQQLFEPRVLLKRVPFCVKPEGGADQVGIVGPAVQIRWPNVKSVVLSGTPMRWRIWCFTNLESLTLKFLAVEARASAEEFRNVLQTVAHTLRHLDIQGSTPVITEEEELELELAPLDPVQLSELRELCIGYTEPRHLFWLIRSIRAPALVSLEICDLWECYGEFCTEIEQSPMSFMGDGMSRDASEVFGMAMEYRLFALGGIKHLTLRFVRLQPGLIDALTVSVVDESYAQYPSLSLSPAERFLLSLSSLDTLTLEATDFEALALNIFRNPQRLPKNPLRVLHVDSCDPWRVGYADPGSEEVRRQTSYAGDFCVEQSWSSPTTIIASQ